MHVAKQKRGGGPQRKHARDRERNVCSSFPFQVVCDCNGGGRERGEDQRPAENTVSRGEQDRKLLVFTVTGFTAAARKIFGHQKCPRRNGGEGITQQRGMRTHQKNEMDKNT